ncbi:MAG TPA: amino acid permease [Candidatus Coatesbacteria bacterium]|nr:amino acid permease [Candidatus Coatesbacteria bacterium]
MPLKRRLTLLDAFAIAAGAMISSGLFVLPGIAYAKAGPSSILAYLLAGVLMIPTMLAKAELATAMPKAGGNYFFITRGLGGLAGTMGGLADWFSISLKSAFALIGIGAFAKLAFPGLTEVGFKLVAVTGVVLFTAMNILSVKIAGRFQVILTLSLLAILGFYIAGGSTGIQLARYEPFFTSGFREFFSTTGLVFISFGGLTKLASMGEEIDDPGKNIPRAMFLAFAAVEFVTVFAVAATCGLVEPANMAGSLTPLSDGASVFAGAFGGIILAIAAMMAFITTANAGIMAASRAPLGMSRDHLLPRFFAKVSHRQGTPTVALVVTGGFMTAMIIFLDLESLVKVASASLLFLFSTVNLSLITLRFAKVKNYRPKFKSPLFPVLPILAIIVYVFLITEMGMLTLLLFGGLLLLGIVWYIFYARLHQQSSSALLALTQRLLSREVRGITGHEQLEKELLQIVKERDDIRFDRFDRLIQQAPLLDLPESVSVDELFRIVAQTLSKELDLPPDELSRLLHEREAESTTAISPGLAIPHVICPGTGCFSVMLVRCQEGIDFGADTGPVHLVFVMAGSQDERNFHLRALMAIAHIVHEVTLETLVNTADTMEEIRDRILLSKRPRHN